MKKVILLGSVLVLGLVSCSKEYTCTCEKTDQELGITLTDKTNYSAKDLDEAKKTCSDRASELEKQNYKVTWSVVSK